MSVSPSPASQPNPRLLQILQSKMRLGPYSLRTEQAYAGWVVRFVRFHRLRHPRDMGEREVAAFLTWLAEERRVALSTQVQAQAALVFLYREVLERPPRHAEPGPEGAGAQACAGGAGRGGGRSGAGAARAGERLAPPESCASPSRLIDVAPTLLARAGARPPAAMQGLDLEGDIAARSESQRMVFAEENNEGNVLRAVRTARWKWIEANENNPRGVPPLELFDVSVDPREQQNLAEREPGTLAELRRHADGHELAARQGRVGEAKAAAISDEERASLCALGYLQGEECEAQAGLPEGGR